MATSMSHSLALSSLLVFVVVISIRHRC
ncbi:hypothetical protein DFA_11551 [Cavenderia fasciculata]|uniref:Uncharacterized protein n=1 Tax=Cavenderia fasciculata TaxID=261658 RepID=F4QDJ3_CACFS|nr:hypothetical protein DFA_11551 [Cavenderia fasciculata]EGG13790.1 hypothetical protein DFA_11551 [Cavenderia fasciculata]|eukprot:XP_004350498.1 hypothetical protein DFA_11551 [Cavenderia fasciculata]